MLKPQSDLNAAIVTAISNVENALASLAHEADRTTSVPARSDVLIGLAKTARQLDKLRDRVLASWAPVA